MSGNHIHNSETIVAPPDEDRVGPSSDRSYREMQADLAGSKLLESSTPFINWLGGWQAGLRSVELGDVVSDPDRTMLLSVDVVVGFCNEGPLASPRVGAIVPPIVDLLNGLHGIGVSRMVFAQEWHEPDAPEFAQYPPHCVRGTREAEMVDELAALPFADKFQIVRKNSISAALNTDLNEWLEAPEQRDVDTFIVVGDCTDLCVYQAAMHLKLRANAANRRIRVVLPEDCLQTFDTPVPVAQQLSILPHDGDLLHAVFLYNMAANGVEVFKHIGVNAAQ